MTKRIGVLALPDAFSAHRQVLETLGHQAVDVRHPKDLDQIDGLFISGRDHVALGKRLACGDLGQSVKFLAAKDLPIFGTCAGMTQLAKTIFDSDQHGLGLMDITVELMTFGNEPGGFQANIEVPALGKEPFRTVFYNAPHVRKVAPNVGILAEFDRKIIFVRQGNLIAASFCPEFTSDHRVHRYFLDVIDEYWD